MAQRSQRPSTPPRPGGRDTLSEQEQLAVDAASSTPPQDAPATFGELPPGFPFRPVPARRQVHLGQRKLLMGEIEFLMAHGGKSDLVLYVGAAPGNHIELLATLFPQHSFHLCDPARFAVEPSDRVQIHRQYFREEDFGKYAGRRVLLISDIRAGPDRDSDCPDVYEERVEEDNQLQQRIVQGVDPAAAMLKFRIPFDHRGPYRYLDGEIHLQCWAKEMSAETRLWVLPRNEGASGQEVPDEADELLLEILGEPPPEAATPVDRWPLKDYDPQDYEGRLYRHNLSTRDWARFPPLREGFPPGLDGCYDCARELKIWAAYVGDHPPPGSIGKLASAASACCRTPHPPPKRQGRTARGRH